MTAIHDADGNFLEGPRAVRGQALAKETRDVSLARDLSSVLVAQAVATVALEEAHEAKQRADAALAEWVSTTPEDIRFDVAGFAEGYVFILGEESRFNELAFQRITLRGCRIAVVLDTINNPPRHTFEVMPREDSQSYWRIPVESVELLAISQPPN